MVFGIKTDIKVCSSKTLDFADFKSYLYNGFVLGGLERVASKEATRFFILIESRISLRIYEYPNTDIHR